MYIVFIVSITVNTLRSVLRVYGNFCVIALYDKISVDVRTPAYFYRRIPVFPFLECENSFLYRDFLAKIFVMLSTNSSFTRRIGV
ncbi:hypothetical protein [Leptospira mayottensis]|uniref:hypothetical protein n=1 Tax=Leptospira mayottensis TaxID=1137606 RepID=UPI000E35F5AE|nr:hypothetical protein [Leptospira mayottensis]AXR69211.1 hypothetical protein DPV73_15485 [Leptospira mayottensis]